jgi:arylsulfatase
VIYILIDDVGFAEVGSYGAAIRTPTVDALAKEGLRYNAFENRALCSPTRAALLTGRDSFTVGMAGLATSDMNVAHTRGFISPAAATVAQILATNGYRTSAVGKWHLIPAAEQPVSTTSRINWPSGKGFQNFYGWLIGWTDQWRPNGVGREIMEGDGLAQETRPPGWHVSEAIVTKGIEYLKKGFAENPQQPQFLYVAFGAGHSPVQAPKEYIDRYRGVYEKGWDVLRAETFARQKKMGLIPADAVLTPRPPNVPAWDSLSELQKTVYARYMANYAGFMEHADAQIGRLVAYLKEAGQFDNTLLFYMHDNGPAGGNPDGSFSSCAGALPTECGGAGVTTVEQVAARLDDLGGPNSSPSNPLGWAHLGATPFQQWKNSAHAGGVRSPLIISWPATIRDRGAIRSQFVELVDLTPTVLDVAGIQAPGEFNGVEQFEMAGRSIRPTFTDARAETRKTQIFLLGTQRAVRHNGWKAVATHQPGTSFDQDTWQLFHTEKDYSEATNVAAQYPEKLAELKTVWQSEARRLGAFPLMDGGGRGRGRGGEAGRGRGRGGVE